MIEPLHEELFETEVERLVQAILRFDRKAKLSDVKLAVFAAIIVAKLNEIIEVVNEGSDVS